MNVLFLLVATIFLLPSIVGSADQGSDPNTNLLRAKDQALLDAIAPGDRKVWDDLLAIRPAGDGSMAVCVCVYSRALQCNLLSVGAQMI